jgi:uncharacterized sulfatase
MTDTQRWDMLGCYGRREMITPNLDRLAADGVLFERAYTCQGVCGPARAALFTGMWPHSCGSWANCMPLGDNVRTIGKRLSDQGVHTAYMGKWHLDGSDYFGNGVCPAGWDKAYWYDMRTYLDELAPQQRRQSRVAPDRWSADVDEQFTYGHRVSDRAIQFLQRHGREDFLLVVSYDEPHGPFLCPRRFRDMYRDYRWPNSPAVFDTLQGKPDHQRAWAGSGPPVSPDDPGLSWPEYFGCNSFADYQIGRVLDAIDRHAPDALVIYTSDHGDALRAHRLSGKGPAAYDDITRIPLIVRWPGHAPAARCPHPVSHIDLAPTVWDAFGFAPQSAMEGRSMLATLRDPGVRPNDAVFMEFGRYETDHDGFGGFQPMRAAFDGRYKLVINLLSSDELYDLHRDPHEMDNRIASPELAAVRDRLHESLLDWMNRTRDPFRGYHWHRRPWRASAPPATWSYTGMTRQREDEAYEPRQLDYDTGVAMESATRRKGAPG